MIEPPDPPVRGPTIQSDDVAAVEKLRNGAADLRSRVSQGSYEDEELRRFWDIARSAGIILWTSNAELGARAGLGNGFFSSVARDHRRPKLTNFLKALTAIIDVADERLRNVPRAGVSGDRLMRGIDEKGVELWLLATSLGQLARNEIARLDSERPNDISTLAENKKQRDLLLVFANGFERIVAALTALAENPREPLLLGKAREIVDSVGNQINRWWTENGAEAIDWGIRLPVVGAGVAALNWAGADMSVATMAVAAMVGGTKVVGAFKGRKESE